MTVHLTHFAHIDSGRERNFIEKGNKNTSQRKGERRLKLAYFAYYTMWLYHGARFRPADGAGRRGGVTEHGGVSLGVEPPWGVLARRKLLAEGLTRAPGRASPQSPRQTARTAQTASLCEAQSSPCAQRPGSLPGVAQAPQPSTIAPLLPVPPNSAQILGLSRQKPSHQLPWLLGGNLGILEGKPSIYMLCKVCTADFGK
ncbi:Uncharacterized protein TCM_020577 [Theobroma cacao]|uniref:Uncharacterized protein n=1 Tax=Theobroma cacao TaxID=3641 RepID=A0A061ELA0_THECC|nr:Uncharacterized protein TCM_020577 [Theobroma cacao]